MSDHTTVITSHHTRCEISQFVPCRQPVGLLADLAEYYLEARGGETLRPESLQDATSWARKPARGASSLLIPAGDDRVLAFDYLIDLATEPVPVPVWLGVVAWCTPEQALSIGLTARRLSRFEAAEAAFAKAADADLPGAKAAQAELIGSGGYPHRAVELLTETLSGLGPDDPETLGIRTMLARFTQKIDESEAASRMFAELLDDCATRLGADHPDTLEVRLQAAIQLGEARMYSEAVGRLVELVDDSMRVHGPDHHETLRVRQQHAAWTDRHGERARAVELFEELLADRIRVQGPDHPNVLSTRYAIAVRTRDADDPERATAVFRELLLDSVRVLGEHHPHTGLARYRLALSERDAGRTDQALEQLAIVHTTWINRFGPNSQLTTRVRDLITSLKTR